MAEDSAIGTPAESPLAPAILRGLGDRSYEKRKNAALEIEALIKTLEDNNETDRICSIIVLLGQDFATSTNAHHRKGGLIGLAATAIGLMSVGVIYLTPVFSKNPLRYFVVFSWGCSTFCAIRLSGLLGVKRTAAVLYLVNLISSSVLRSLMFVLPLLLQSCCRQLQLVPSGVYPICSCGSCLVVVFAAAVYIT